MPDVRTLLRPVAVALLLAAGGLLLWPAPPAHACLPGTEIMPLPADAVVFEGTLLVEGTRLENGHVLPFTIFDGGTWAYTVKVGRVLHGSVGPRAVVVDPSGGSSCPKVRYEGVGSQRVIARPDPITGTLRPLLGNYVVPPAPRFQWFASPSGAAFGTWVVLVFLAEMAILGLATLAGGVYLRARELDLEERELALREREAGRRP